MAWQDLRAQLEAESKRFATEPPEEVVQVVRFRIEDLGAGTDGQIMGTWFYTLNDVRYLLSYMYNIIGSAMNPAFTPAQLKYMYKKMMLGPAEYVGYSGFPTVWKFVKAVGQEMEPIAGCEQLLDLFNSLYLYLAYINAYIEHYFPWEISLNYPHRSKAQVREMAALIGEG